MDYSNPLGIEYRIVNEIVHLDQPARVVSGSRNYETDPNDLWDALTNADRIPRWFLPISGNLELGGQYQLKGNAGGKITRCDPPKKLEVTWEYGGNVSWVHVTLEPTSDKTKLTLEHITGKDEASEQHWKQFGPGATGVGWDLGFLGLGLHLVTGETINQEEANQWYITDAGKEFIRRCAEAWGTSHIESGESVETAKELAEQTAKAYTGEL